MRWNDSTTRHTAAALAAAVFFLAPGAARALDPIPLEEPPRPPETRLHFGRFRVRPIFRIENLGYDDNVFLTGPGTEVADLTGSVIVGAEGQAVFSDRAALTLAVEPGWTFYADTSSQNYNSITARARGDVFLRNASLSFAGTHVDTSERTGNEIDRRARLLLTTLGGSAGLFMERRLSLLGGVTERSVRYPDESDIVIPDPTARGCAATATTLGDLLDRREREVAIRPRYRTLGDGALFAEFSHTDAQFDVCTDRDTERRTLQLGLQNDPFSRLALRVQAGPARLDPRDPGRSGFSGILGRAEITWRPMDAWQVRGGWTRDTPFSIVGDNIFAEETNWSGSLLRSVGARVALEAGGTGTQLLWPEPTCLGFGSPGPTPTCTGESIVRRDRIVEWFFGTRFRADRRTELSLRAAWRQRDSNVPGAEDSRVTILTGVNLP